MHGQLGHTGIHGTNSRLGRNGRSDGRSTRTIVLDDKFLNRNVGATAQFSHDKARHAIGGIALIGIGFDHDTGIEKGGMDGFMFRSIIGMKGVGLVKSLSPQRFRCASRPEWPASLPAAPL